jgi:hypothetical protein
MPYVGRQNSVGIAKDTTRNTAMTTPSVFIPWDSFDMQVKNTPFEDKSALGIRDELLYSDIAYQALEGKLGGKTDADTIIYWLYYLLGQGTPTTASGATTWVLTSANNTQLPSFTSFYQRGDSGFFASTGTTVSELNIKGDAGGESTYETSIMALNESSISTPTISYTKPTRYQIGKNITIGYATSTSGLSSATAFNCRSFELSLKNNSQADMALGSLTPIDIFAQKFDVSLKFTITLRSTPGSTFETDYKAGNKKAFKIAMVNQNAASIGTSGLKPTVNLVIPPSRYDIVYKYEKDNVMTLDVVTFPEFSVTDGFSFQGTVINSLTAIA